MLFLFLLVACNITKINRRQVEIIKNREAGGGGGGGGFLKFIPQYFEIYFCKIFARKS